MNPLKISYIYESFGIWDPSTAIEAKQPFEQLTLTKDKSDSLWYSQSNVEIPVDSDSPVTISIKSVTHIWYAWIDGVLARKSISTNDNLLTDIFCELP